MDQFQEKVALYQDRVTAFMVQAKAWCIAHGLKVEGLPTWVNEQVTVFLTVYRPLSGTATTWVKPRQPDST